MRAFSRRRLFGAAAAGTVAAVSASGLSGCARTTHTGHVVPSALPLPQPFTQELRPVGAAQPVTPGHYVLTERVATVEVLPGRRTEVWGYDGQFPGPTLQARTGEPMIITIRNELPTPTSTHLHGALSPGDQDGLPLDLVVPDGFDTSHLDHAMDHDHDLDEDNPHAGMPMPWTLHERQRDYRHALDQPAALLWYHDHRMDFSAPQVWRGLAGMVDLTDPQQDELGLPSDDRHLDLMFTDRSFGEDAELHYPALDPTLMMKAGVERAYHDGVLGDVMLVNGTPFPYAPVRRTTYRLRLLNACNARPLRITFRTDAGRDLPLTQIGTDHGLLATPLPITTVMISPAERVDVIIDLSAVPDGTTVTLANSATEDMPELMQLKVSGQGPAPDPLPEVLVPDFEVLDDDADVLQRHFDFRLTSGMWGINGHIYDPRTSQADSRHGSVERWVFTSDFNHPVHLHQAAFQVVNVNGKATKARERGWKDTVAVTPYGVVEVLVRFGPDPGESMLHCHNLEHEDMGMMARTTVT